MQTNPKRLGAILAALMVATVAVSPLTTAQLRAGDVFENSDPVSKEQKAFDDLLQQGRTYFEGRIAFVNKVYDKFHASVLAEKTAYWQTKAGPLHLTEAQVAEQAGIDTEADTAEVRACRDAELAKLGSDRLAMENAAAKRKSDLDSHSNSDFARATRVAKDFIDKRIEASKRETTIEAKVIKVVADVSLEDIKKYGPLGGPNSVFRNPDQILGGPNSFARNPGQIAGGPDSVINNPKQIFGGDNSVFNNPKQIFGGDNSVFNNPKQIFGGDNSVFNNPGQLFGW